MTPALPHTLPGEKLILGLLSPTTEQGASHLNTHELCSDPCTASPLLSPHLLPSCPPSEQERGLVWPLLLTMELWRLETCVFPGGYKQMDFFFLFKCLVANEFLKNPLSPHVRALTL